MRDLISGEAELGSDEEDDQSFDEETGEARQRKEQAPDMDDSSEEEEDDDDAEAARAVCSAPERARGAVPMILTNRSYRSAKVSLSTMRKMRSQRHGNGAGGSVAVLSARRRRPLWMKRISI
jgi:hypothetical protein